MTHHADQTYTLAQLEQHCRANGFEAEAEICARYRLLKAQRGAWPEAVAARLRRPQIVPRPEGAAA